MKCNIASVVGLVREGQGLLDDLLHGAVVVRAPCVDPQVEPLEELPLARRRLGHPAPEGAHGGQVRVPPRPRAHEHEAADEPGVAQRQLLGDDAASG